jgi:hypothetical protein
MHDPHVRTHDLQHNRTNGRGTTGLHHGTNGPRDKTLDPRDKTLDPFVMKNGPRDKTLDLHDKTLDPFVMKNDRVTNALRDRTNGWFLKTNALGIASSRSQLNRTNDPPAVIHDRAKSVREVEHLAPLVRRKRSLRNDPIATNAKRP